MATTANHEMLLVTGSTEQQWSVSAWDLHTGSSVRKFKGQAVKEGCLCLRAGHTLIGAAADKPLLQLWPLCKKDEPQQKIVCPGPVSAMALSPDGLFCVASINEKTYVWEMTAGNLLGVVNDFDEVKMIRFTDEGSHFIAGTSSGLVIIWDFADVVSATRHSARRVSPRRRITAHSNCITEVYVGCGGLAARMVTSSKDNTCKLWDMLSGDLIRTLIYETVPHSVIMDKQEKFLIVGLDNGGIMCSPLYAQTSQLETFVSKDATKAGEFFLQRKGNAVTCLALSSDSRHLAAGSKGGQVHVWDLEQGKISGNIDVSGAVGNLMIIPPIVQNARTTHHGPPISFKQQTASETDGRGRVFNVCTSDSSELKIPDYCADIAKMLALSSDLDVHQGTEDGEDSMSISEKISSQTEKIQALERKVAHLKRVNKELYGCAAKKIVAEIETDSD